MAVVGEVGAGEEGEAVAVGLGGDVAQELEGIAGGFGAGEFQGEDDEAAGCEVGGESEDGFHGFVRRAVHVAEQGMVAGGFWRGEFRDIGGDEFKPFVFFQTTIQRSAVQSGDAIPPREQFRGHAAGGRAQLQPVAVLRQGWAIQAQIMQRLGDLSACAGNGGGHGEADVAAAAGIEPIGLPG